MLVLLLVLVLEILDVGLELQADASDSRPVGDCRTLPRSGYTEQPRVLTLGQAQPRSALKAPPTRYAGVIRRGNIRFKVQRRFWAAKRKAPTRRLEQVIRSHSGAQ